MQISSQENKQYNNIQEINKYPYHTYEVFMPIFPWKDIGSDSLLERCIDGERQNAIGSLNVSKRCTSRQVEVEVPVVQVPVEASENEGELVCLVSVCEVVDIEETATDTSDISGDRLMDTTILKSIFN